MNKTISLTVILLLLLVTFLWTNASIALNLRNPPAIAVPFPPDPSNINSEMIQPGRVELDIFSTRTNPTWILSSENLETFRTMLEKLPTTQPFEFLDNLGYRGFVVEVPEADRVVLVKVYQDQVQYDLEGNTRFLVDRDLTIERWLLTNAKAILPESLYLKVETQVQNAK